MNEPIKARLLIVDDEEDMLRLLKRSLSADLDCEIETASNAFQALALLEAGPFDVVLADIRMPGMDGMEFLERVQRTHSGLTVALMTAYGTIDLAVQAIKSGAYDFITKPFEHDKLTHLLGKALERSRLVRENLRLLQRIRERENFHEMVGMSPKMQKIFETIRVISKTDVTVLLTGESGTGKDMAARAIHGFSPRSTGPYVAVNCPNLPESILESELFGTRKGRSLTRRRIRTVFSGRRIAGPFISTKSATFPPRFRPSSSACSRKRKYDRSGRTRASK